MALQRRESFFMFYVIAFVFVAIAAVAVYFFWSGKQKRLEEETKARAALVDKGPLIATAVSVRGPDVPQDFPAGRSATRTRPQPCTRRSAATWRA